MSWLLAILAAGGLYGAEDEASSAAAGSPDPADTVRAVAFRADPGNPTVGLSFLVPSGRAQDPEGGGGAGRLLADALTLKANERGAPMGVRVEAEVGGDFTVFTATAPATAWLEAYALLGDVLFRGGPTEGRMEEARDRTLSRLVFEDGSPVNAFERRVRELLHGDGDPWGGRSRGTADEVRQLALADLEGLHADGYRSSSAILGVTGALEQEELAARVVGEQAFKTPGPEDDGGTFSLDAEEPVASDTVEREEADSAEDPSDGAPQAGNMQEGPDGPGAGNGMLDPARRVEGAEPAWSDGERRTVEGEVTSTWLVAAFPLPASTQRREVRFLEELFRERLTPSPPDRDLYELSVETRHLPGGPVVLVRATVFPVAAYQWEEEILEGVDDLGTQPPEGVFFDLARRAFATGRYLEDADPAARSHRLALELFEDGRVAGPTDGVAELDPEWLQGLISSLGPPRILLYGPLEMARPVSNGTAEDR